MRLIYSILLSLCAYLLFLNIVRITGTEAEVFDFIGRLTLVIGLIYTVQPIADKLYIQDQPDKREDQTNER